VLGYGRTGGVVVVVGGEATRLHAPFYGRDALHPRGRHLHGYQTVIRGTCPFHRWRWELTRWISDDSVKEPAASPRVSGDVEGAQVQDALSHTVLGRGTHDPRLGVWQQKSQRRVRFGIPAKSPTFPAHLATIDVGAKHERTEMSGRLRASEDV
jgi:hypothetical protein